ncbi:MAG: response regulator [Candidatus Magnetomorum sp.]|nr:response regulator [Candidatus Magnetomorum sp.]
MTSKQHSKTSDTFLYVNEKVEDLNWAQTLSHNNVSILIVDDDSNNRKLLSSLTETMEMTCYEAENGKRAVDLFKQNIIDLILMDLYMPVMDGFQATYTIKKNSGDTFIPIIVLTAANDEALLSKALAYGADDYMTKPVSFEILISKINTMLRIRDLYQKLQKQKDALTREIIIRKQATKQLISFQKDLEHKIQVRTNALREKDIQLIEMDRIAGIGSLASGMSHEINNPLGSVRSSLDMIKKNINTFLQLILKNDDQDRLVTSTALELHIKIDRMYTRAIRGIDRIVNIINSLKYISNVEKDQDRPIDINKNIEETIHLLKADNQDKALSFITSYGKVPELSCMSSEINLCLFNVLKNAKEAIRSNGHIQIQTSYSQKTDTIQIIITDNGPGMSEETLKFVFHPFHTTKPVGQGTGIGLTLTERIIKRHHGSIRIDSKEGEGTTVTIILPVKLAP